MSPDVASERSFRTGGPAPSILALVCVLAGLAVSQGPGVATSRTAEVALPGTRQGGWREARGDPANTGVSHGPSPAITRVKWRFIADSEVFNAPAVDGGSVYFGSKGGRLYAVRTEDGSKVWERLHAGQAPGEAGPFGFTYSAVLVHGGRLYAGSEDGHLVCVSQATGDLIWRRHLGGVGEGGRVWASPKTDGRLIFVGSNAGFLWAFDAVGGEVRWKTWLGDEIGGTVAIVGGDLFVPAKDRRLHALDALTGKERWQVDLGGSSKSSPAVQLGLAFVRASGGRFVCVDLVARSLRWTAELPYAPDAQTSAAHDGERAYVTNGPVVAAVGLDGSPEWQIRARASFDTSPVVVGGHVVLAGNDNLLRALDKRTGATARELDLGCKVVATPTVVDGVVYVASAPGIVFAVE